MKLHRVIFFAIKSECKFWLLQTLCEVGWKKDIFGSNYIRVRATQENSVKSHFSIQNGSIFEHWFHPNTQFFKVRPINRKIFGIIQCSKTPKANSNGCRNYFLTTMVIMCSKNHRLMFLITGDNLRTEWNPPCWVFIERFWLAETMPTDFQVFSPQSGYKSNVKHTHME